jgi:NADH-quinone oxidoreductase subunit L
MGAGSVIGAMAGSQSLDRMGGFRKAMPFTFVTFTVAALALAGFPLFSGFFSKDEVLAYTLHRGGGFVVLAVVGYLAAGLTAFYAFRMVFRVFFRAPVPEARELEQGHPHHGEPHNPVTGEPEDTHVGFDGTEHHNAESSWIMKAAMAPLAVLALIGGFVGIPGLTDTLEHFLEPTFADSRFAESKPTESAEYIGLGVGALIAIAGIAAAAAVFLRRRELRLIARERLSAVHTFLFHKWYFDELYDAAVVRPMAAFGRFGRNVIETRFVQETIVGGAVGLVRAGSSMARSVQSGYLRAYAALLVVGVTALGVYFLITAAG